MRRIEIEVPEDAGEQRADLFITSQMPGATRSTVQKLIEDGNVLCGEHTITKNKKVQPGEKYVVTMPKPVPTAVQAQDIPLDIVYEDDDVIAVNKPRGMVVHPAAGHMDGTLVNALLHHCGSSLSGINGEIRPGIVHRIDRDTSGVIVAAKNDHAHVNLVRQLQDHSMYRIYEAVVVGTPDPEEGRVDAPIGRHPFDRTKMAVIDRNSRYAITHYRVLERYTGYSHIECRLETGRTHQIRVHMAYIGHPIVGDTVYGAKKSGICPGGQCLHARRIVFTHPVTGERIELETPLPDYFVEVLTKLQKADNI